MNGRTASLINSFARLSGQGESRRAMKRAWNDFTVEQKTKFRKQLKTSVSQLRGAEQLRAQINTNKSVRRYLAGDGSRVLWFLDEDGLGSTMHLRRGDDIQLLESAPAQAGYTRQPLSIQGFDKFWAFACSEPIPPPDLEPLNLPSPTSEPPAIVAAPAQQEAQQ